ncbi:NAD-dependent epimerase/dehydratase family protein [Bacillus sp. NEB1478]|uniref:NAD-dependent epimerase/dehydratase family protein n=1 Tax=Bacillus sp. NEB1478 TaxID=3073816 RepID=UPI002872F464|nr:NAD-dependent epimerase/dehydratase family protein [Bacillus sp. NEB1478]WNB91373.1 NAD-dependent epimerase/dehydratase family protein [Bacillus sp. NEB1478]
MKVLIIGGTRFLGKHLTDSLLKNNHEVTLFHRGNTPPPEKISSCEIILGDREKDLSPLENRTWDAIIDTCGFLPIHVRKMAETLKQNAASYVYISSVSVYADQSKRNITEEDEVSELKDPNITEFKLEMYGELKAQCEKEVQNIFKDRALIVRPGLIVGPYDYTDRFTYWPDRGARGGDILVPDMKDPTVRFIDARDLSDWIVRMVENKENGVYQAVGGTYNFNDFIQKCLSKELDTKIVSVPESFLLEEGVGEWVEMPLWISSEDYRGLDYADDSKAVNKGLAFRSLEETIQDTASWSLSRRQQPEQWKAGLHPDKEKDLLRKWTAKTKNGD